MSDRCPWTQHYRVLWSGALDARALRFEDHPAVRTRLDAKDRRGIEETIARRRAKGQVILQSPSGSLPPLYALLSFEGRKSALCLHLGRTDYGEYLYTNVEHPERRAQRGDDAMSDALAVCAVLVTGDRQVLFGERSASIADRDASSNSAQFHILPAGHPQPPHDPLEGLLLELEEEAGVGARELTRMLLTGLVRALPSGKPELTYLLETNLTWRDIRAREAKDAWEFESLLGFPWTCAGAARWLELHHADACAPALAAVALAAALEFTSERASGLESSARS